MSFVAWPDIEGFHAVRKAVTKYPELLGGRNTVAYQVKVKLHGTNAGIFCKAGRFTAQSRTAVITTGNDNAGFAAWVESEKVQEAMASAYKRMPSDMVMYGEWCGPGVQKGVAISQIERRHFAVFAASCIDNKSEPRDDLIVEPFELSEIMKGVPDCKVIPWHGHRIEVPWLNAAEELQSIVDGINACVDAVELQDPWVKSEFGIDGTGEGIVYYPISHSGRKRFGDLAFKAKGEKHRVVAHSKPAQVDPAKAEGAEKFAELVLPEPRLEQGARHVGGGNLTYEMRLTGPFLAWVGGDVQKECGPELEASGLSWKDVQKAVSERARKWYVEKAKAI